LKLTVLVNSGVSVVWTRESIYLKWCYWFEKFLTLKFPIGSSVWS